MLLLHTTGVLFRENQSVSKGYNSKRTALSYFAPVAFWSFPAVDNNSALQKFTSFFPSSSTASEPADQGETDGRSAGNVLGVAMVTEGSNVVLAVARCVVVHSGRPKAGVATGLVDVG